MNFNPPFLYTVVKERLSFQVIIHVGQRHHQASTKANTANTDHGYSKDRIPFNLGPQLRLADDKKYKKPGWSPPHSLSELQPRAESCVYILYRGPGKCADSLRDPPKSEKVRHTLEQTSPQIQIKAV